MERKVNCGHRITVICLKMSSIPSIQCLFCKHLNPAGAIFCNECGTQLNVQPCDHCGAIDARDARNCHKCGSEFPSHAMPEPGPVSELLTNGQGSALESPALDAQPPEPMNVGGGENAHNMPAAGAGSRRNWLLPAAAGLSLALIAVAAFVYFDRVQPERIAQKPGATQAVLVRSAMATGAQTTQPVPDEAALAPTRPVTDAANRAGAPGDAAAPAPPVADSPISVLSAPATDAGASTGQNSLASNDCPQAIATLGLCNPGAAAEKRQ